MSDIDRKALYWCLKLSRIAVYNQLFVEEDPIKLREGIDRRTAILQKACLDNASYVLMALGRELDIDS